MSSMQPENDKQYHCTSPTELKCTLLNISNNYTLTQGQNEFQSLTYIDVLQQSSAL